MRLDDNHVMVDLETADTVPTGAIISIGAIVFSGPQQGNRFYLAVDLQSSVDAGLTVSTDTMDWWGKQSNQARQVFDDPSRRALRDALREFANFLPDNCKLWGNGAAFDNAILANAYRCVGLAQPWDFWNDRCYRTVAARIAIRRQQKGTYHNALDDAISQADHLMAYAPEAVV